MSLDLGTVLLQWATGGLLFFWWTARREVVGIGYGWLLRGVYGVMAVIALLLEVRSDHTGAGSRHRDRRRGRASCSRRSSRSRSAAVAARRRRARPARRSTSSRRSSASSRCSGWRRSAGGAYWLAALRLLSGAVFLGAVTDAMLLGHWYLVQPGLSRAPLEELVTLCLYVWPIEVIALLPAARDDRRAERLGRRRVRRAARLDVGRLRADDDRARLGHAARAARAVLLRGDGRDRPALPRDPHRVRHRRRRPRAADAVAPPSAAGLTLEPASSHLGGGGLESRRGGANTHRGRSTRSTADRRSGRPSDRLAVRQGAAARRRHPRRVRRCGRAARLASTGPSARSTSRPTSTT